MLFVVLHSHTDYVIFIVERFLRHTLDKGVLMLEDPVKSLQKWFFFLSCRHNSYMMYMQCISQYTLLHDYMQVIGLIDVIYYHKPFFYYHKPFLSWLRKKKRLHRKRKNQPKSPKQTRRKSLPAFPPKRKSWTKKIPIPSRLFLAKK